MTEPENTPTRADFFERVWALVQKIPPGRVTTYGHVARALGLGRSARTVGWALKMVMASDDPLAVPCHRVVNREGTLTGRMHFETPFAMEERLRAEGVSFLDDGRVDLDRHLWVPRPRDVGGRDQAAYVMPPADG